MSRQIELLKWAKKEGYKVERKRYEYWDNVLFIGETAIVIDVIGYNSTGIISNIAEFPRFFTLAGMKIQIEIGNYSIGTYNATYKPFRNQCKYSWNDEMADLGNQ